MTPQPGPESLLSPREAYRLWAATYDEENVLLALDGRAARLLTPPLPRLALLDAACGTARRLAFSDGAGPLAVAGIDIVLEMLLRARQDPARSRHLAAGDVQALPVASETFDVVWCRLAAGYVQALLALYRELSRAARPGGFVVVTDLHPTAVRAGHVRSFRDAKGVTHRVEHTVHDLLAHEAAAKPAGLKFDARLELGVGSEVRRFYEAAGALDRYERDRGLPLLVAFRFRR